MDSLILVCSVALASLTITLAMLTSMLRLKTGAISFDTQLAPTSFLAKVQRAHGNSAEYAGILILLFLIVGFAYQGETLEASIIWTILAITASRVIHALGFLTCRSLESPHVFKAIGVTVTCLGSLFLFWKVILQIV